MKKITITDIKKEYFGKIDPLDLDLILAHVLQKPREFVLAHPEYKIPKLKIENCKLKITRRMHDEPLAYILGSKEFFGLPFLVSPATLIPRPETELMVELTLHEIQDTKYKIQDAKNQPLENFIIADVGTGSGNIIISIAKAIGNFKSKISNLKLYGIDISNEALKIAKKNAKTLTPDNKIKFLHGNLLDSIIRNSKLEIRNSKMIILANLPYLSEKIYNATEKTVKKYEPKSALYSPNEGLHHYEELLKQLKKIDSRNCTLFLEISPEQKIKIPKIVKKYFPKAEIEFKKDLASKWRVCKIEIN